MPNLRSNDADFVTRALANAAQNRWCTHISCTTCGSTEFREAVGLLGRNENGQIERRQISLAEAQALVGSLKRVVVVDPPNDVFNEGIMLVLYSIWQQVGDAEADHLFTELDGTHAGTVLERMRVHYRWRLESRRLHATRQGVKKNDWLD